MANKLFRQAALEKLASPERLDVLMRVTAPAGWLALSAVGVALLVAILWGVWWGRINIKVRGQGMLMHGEELLSVTSGTYGQVTDILIKRDQTIEVGDVVARLSQPRQEERIRNKQAELADRTSRAQSYRATQGAILSEKRRQLRDQEETINDKREALAKGFITEAQLRQAEGRATSLREEIAQINATLRVDTSDVARLERELSSFWTELGSTTEITSPYRGRVIEISANLGKRLNPGDPVLTLEGTDEPLAAIVFIPSHDGKKVKEGMRVQISPSTVKPEEWGFMLGEVRTVSDFPVTRERLKSILGDETLITDLAGRSAPFQVMVTLHRNEDPENASGFQWSSGSGPPTGIYSGTVCSGNITVEVKKPASYVLPIFKRMTGLG